MHLPLSQWKSRGEQVGSTGFKRTQTWVRWAGQTRLHCPHSPCPCPTRLHLGRGSRRKEWESNRNLYSETAKREKQGCGSNLVGRVWPHMHEALGLITSLMQLGVEVNTCNSNTWEAQTNYSRRVTFPLLSSY